MSSYFKFVPFLKSKDDEEVYTDITDEICEQQLLEDLKTQEHMFYGHVPEEEYTEWDNIDHQIATEKLKDAQVLESEIQALQDCMQTMSQYLEVQQPTIDNVEQDLENTIEITDQAVNDLEESSRLADAIRNRKSTMFLVGTGLGVGAIGFLGGPLLGVATVTIGGLLGGGIAKATKIETIR